eukprot:scaffold28654_cov139-Skeletonema_dohrnii-CCMP3373.AAC.1
MGQKYRHNLAVVTSEIVAYHELATIQHIITKKSRDHNEDCGKIAAATIAVTTPVDVEDSGPPTARFN